MRTYNSVDPLADIKYWWRYEAWPIDKLGVYLVAALFATLCWHIVTFEPAVYVSYRAEQLAADRANWEPMTADDIARLTPDQIPPPVPLDPKYAGYLDRNRQSTNVMMKRKKSVKQADAKILKKKPERKISSAKHKRSDRKASGKAAQ